MQSFIHIKKAVLTQHSSSSSYVRRYQEYQTLIKGEMETRNNSISSWSVKSDRMLFHHTLTQISTGMY